MLDRIDRRDRALSSRPNGEFDRADTPERRIDHLSFGHRAGAKGDVSLLDLTSLELPSEARVDLAVSREEHHAARAAIEALHEIERRTNGCQEIEKDRLDGIKSALHDQI